MSLNNKKVNLGVLFSERSPALLLSIALHLLVVLIIIISFKQSARIFIAGSKPASVINAYLPNVHAFRVMEAKNNLKVKIVKQERNIQGLENTSKHLAQKISNQKLQGQKIDPLIALLHMAIEQHEHYPQSALEMGRAGRVTVEFRLFPEGNIADLRILKTSGTVALDQAALAAVQAATPFKPAQQYLQRPKVFTLDIVFESTAN